MELNKIPEIHTLLVAINSLRPRYIELMQYHAHNTGEPNSKELALEKLDKALEPFGIFHKKAT